MPCNVGSSSLVYSIVVSSYYWFSLVVSNTRCAFLRPRTMPCDTLHTQRAVRGPVLYPALEGCVHTVLYCKA